MDLEAVIGLEIHFQLKTKSKMFCSCRNIFGDVPPNSAICPICLGYPGTLPVPNQQAITWTQLAGAALNCQLASTSKFDRKSYFYPDLPKGYQISQYDQPFCGPGNMSLAVNDTHHKIGITRIHLEEDAAKNIHPPGANYTLIDYNRAGTPLMEIVTEPDIKSPQQAKVFLQELQRIIRTLGISDADMEKGQLRCDANISLKQQGAKQLNPKTEIKNLNSFRNVERALAYEIKRQTEAFARGAAPKQQSTRGYDAKSGQTVEQRTKEGAADYRYFPEPDIPPFSFSAKQLRQVAVDLPELPHIKKERLRRQYDLSEQHAQLLTDYRTLADFFENTTSELAQLDKERTAPAQADIKPLTQLALNIILRQVRSIINKHNLAATDFKITPANFAELVILVHQKKVNTGTITRILEEMQRTGGDPDHIIQNLGLEQVSSSADLDHIVQDVIKENPDVVAKIKAGKEEATQYLVGQVMSKTKGQANPQTVRQLLSDELKP